MNVSVRKTLWVRSRTMCYGLWGYGTMGEYEAIQSSDFWWLKNPRLQATKPRDSGLG